MDQPQTAETPVCYRHPGRGTRLSCSNCGRPICVECSVDASVGQKCPECAVPEGRNRVITGRDVRRRAATRNNPVTVGIIAIAAVVFVLGILDQGLEIRLLRNFALTPDAIDSGEWYRIITSAFLHGSAYHILFNMWALWIFGGPLEREVGSGPFAALYFASAIAGGAAYLLADPTGIAVGASGAVFGLFGAWLAAAVRNRHTVAGRANLQTLVVLLGINLALPLFVPRIAWEAHVGGLVAGVVITLVWQRWAKTPVTRIATAVAVAALFALALLVL